MTADDACTLSAEPFDLILLDINLPDQTGWDVLRHLEQHDSSPTSGSTMGLAGGASGTRHESRPQVIVITAVRPQQSRLDEFQPVAVLLKPFPIAALLRLIERVLEHAPAEGSNTDDGTGETGETGE